MISQRHKNEMEKKRKSSSDTKPKKKWDRFHKFILIILSVTDVSINIKTKPVKKHSQFHG
jgi:hypothetical protein